MKEEYKNYGGVNGSGHGYVNTNSESFKAVRKAIKNDYDSQTPEERMKWRLYGLKTKMEFYVEPTNHHTKDKIFTVGQYLREHIEALGIKHKEFAQYMDIKESNLSALLKGKRRLSIELAHKLGEIFEVLPSTWLLVQNKNELLEVGQQRSMGKRYRLDELLGKVG